MDTQAQGTRKADEHDLFDRFLQTLDADRERAGERYETIRRKLIKFFEWRGCFHAEDHADEVLRRMMAKFQMEDIRDPATYCYGIARLVYLEVRKSRAREQAALVDLQRTPGPHQQEDQEQAQALACLSRCLEGLPAENVRLILRYYEEEGGAKIELRKRLAEDLAIPMNALRIRALRLRERLELCVRSCLTVNQ